MKPPLALMAELTDARGQTYSLTPHNLSAGERPQDNSFSTELGEGFGTASFALSRRYDRDYPDLGLLNSFALVGEDGGIAYEGQVASIPRSVQEGHAIQVNAEGWMGHARRRPFTEIYIDRDLGRWGDPSAQRRHIMIAATESSNEVGTQIGFSDTGPAAAGILYTFQRFASGVVERGEQWYYGGGSDIGEVRYSLDGPSTDADWLDSFYLSSNDLANATLDSGTDHNGTDATNQSLSAGGAGRKYVLVVSSYGGASTGDFPQTRRWYDIRIFGRHGLTKQGTQPNEGFYASDVMANIASRFAPKLDTSGIEDTTYPISHLAFHEEITPHEAFKELNRFHLWDLGVWENRTLTFRPFDLSTADWEVRVGENGVTADLQGDSIESTANGIVVHYRDFAGVERRITPDDDDELADTNELLPANQHGEQHWTALNISRQCLEADAVQMGRAALAEFNRPKRPGSINVPGHIQDAAGHWQQAWKVRAGQTISVTNHPSDSPRLITATSYNDRSKTVSITVDNALNRLEAVFARTDRALQAANL